MSDVSIALSSRASPASPWGESKRPAIQNQLLAALSHHSPAEFTAIQPSLEPCDLKLGDILQDAGEIVTYVYFPLGALVSCFVILADGEEVATHCVGNEGIIYGECELGLGSAFHKALVVRSGSTLRMSANSWRAALALHPELRDQILRYLGRQSLQLQQTIACNIAHDVESRLCGWLLQMHDHAGRGVIEATHQMLARMMCVRRTTITLIARRLHDARIISYRRGNIEIIDRFALEAAACECHQTIAAWRE
jgi:CRP-like cAMP-binding protein